MKYTNLENSPEYVEKTVKLIESSLGYSPDHSFSTDFYPLINKENHANCHIIVHNHIVVAHIGVLTKKLNISASSFTINMYGGIAVNETFRGRGIFKSFFKDILNKYTDCSVHILWSEKTALYKQFNFYPCINQIEYQKTPHLNSTDTICTKLKNLTSIQLEQVINLYKKEDLRVTRTMQDWQQLMNIDSADLYIIEGESSEIINYFIINKGQDLTNIIHEYGIITPEYLKLFTGFGKVWTPKEFNQSGTHLIAALVRIGDTSLFTNFIRELTKIEIKSISTNVTFTFNNEIYEFRHEDFLQGVLGPGRFKELDDVPYLNISGLDSI